MVVADSSPGSVGRRLLDAGGDRGARCAGAFDQDAARQRDAWTSGSWPRRSRSTRAGQVDGAVRITQSVDAVGRAVRSATVGLVLVGLIVLALGLAAGALLAASVVRPLRRLAAAARRAGEGDLSVRVPVEGSREQREVGARVQRDDRARAADGRRAARLRRRRVAPAADAADRAAPAAGGGGRYCLRGRRVEQVEGALAEVDRLAGVVTELLVLSEAGRARGRPTPRPTCWRAPAARSRAGRRPRSSVVAAASSVVRCTAADLDRILDALIENAIDYGPAGSADHARRLAGPARGRRRGPGLAAGEEETIFARFHRGTVGRASRRRGTGLGLPIARELAARWHGDRHAGQRRSGRRRRDDHAAAGRRHDPERAAAWAGRHDRLAPQPRDRGRRRRRASCSPPR